MDKYCFFCMNEMKVDTDICPCCGRELKYEIPAHHLAPGTILNNKYCIGTAIGEGGFGITYIGLDLNLDMKVAIKEYYPNGFVNRSNTISATVNMPTSLGNIEFFEKGRERFLSEARVLAKFIDEEGVVGVRDFFQCNNTAYIVMDYLDGETLKDYLKRVVKISPEQTLELLLPVMMTLKKIHRHGLIHRDISPDNIMIVNGKIKLLDFGAARAISAIANKSLSIMLKPGYAPEEQYRSKGQQGTWTDIYALCATMYRCITGKIPDESIQRVVEDELKSPSELGISMDINYERALMKGLSVFQKNRYQTIDELILDIQGKDVALEETKSKLKSTDSKSEGSNPPKSKGQKKPVTIEDKTVSLQNNAPQDITEDIDKNISKLTKKSERSKPYIPQSDIVTVYEPNNEIIPELDKKNNKIIEESKKFPFKYIIGIFLLCLVIVGTIITVNMISSKSQNVQSDNSEIQSTIVNSFSSVNEIKQININPFENIKVKYSGNSPYVKVSIDNTLCDDITKKYINYKLPDYYLRNGDKFTITAEIKDNIDDIDIYLSETSKSYSVENRSEYAVSLDGINLDELQKEMNNTISADIVPKYQSSQYWAICDLGFYNVDHVELKDLISTYFISIKTDFENKYTGSNGKYYYNRYAQIYNCSVYFTNGNKPINIYIVSLAYNIKKSNKGDLVWDKVIYTTARENYDDSIKEFITSREEYYNIIKMK